MNIKRAIVNFLCDYRKICKYISKVEADFYFNKNIYLSVICAEDKYFMKHHGISIKSIIRALIKRHGGASTITMQTVRVISGRYEVSFNRKLREIALAFLIELDNDKISILNSYLKYSYFGTGLVGIESVFDKYFPRSNTMSLMDSIFIASLLKRPAPRDVSIAWAYKLNSRMIHIKKIIETEGSVVHKQIEQYIQ